MYTASQLSLRPGESLKMEISQEKKEGYGHENTAMNTDIATALAEFAAAAWGRTRGGGGKGRERTVGLGRGGASRLSMYSETPSGCAL